MKLLPLLLASLMMTFALAGCFGGDDKKDDDEGDGMENGNGDGMTNNTTEEDAVPLSVAVQDVPPPLKFMPNTLSAPANETINLTVSSMGGATGNKLNHNFVIDDVVDLDGIAPGETKSVTFTVTEPGTYPYYCDVPNHRQAGMEGTLTVE